MGSFPILLPKPSIDIQRIVTIAAYSTININIRKEALLIVEFTAKSNTVAPIFNV